MSIQNEVKKQINQFESGKLFDYSDLNFDIFLANSVSQAVNRLVKRGEIRRLTKGKFYKPKMGILGERSISERETLKSILFDKNNCRIGYITGISLFNRLGITTQISSVITIAQAKKRWTQKSFGYLTIKIVPTYAPINDDNVPLLEILDVLQNIKKIPDTSPQKIINSVTDLLKKRDEDELYLLKQLSQNYSPATRALLGMQLDELALVDNTDDLRKSLNPLSIYKIGLVKSPYTKKWNIQ